MDVLPLPENPSLEQYRKRAKDLVAAVRSAEPGAVRAWAADWLAALTRSLGVPVTPFVQESIDRAIDAIEKNVGEQPSIGLADAQHFIARAHGFESWAGFTRLIEETGTPETHGGRFEAAADAVVTGNVGLLLELLHEDPELTQARSARSHRATLLHYLAANGVEDFRQKTPPNAVTVARLLLERGAEVDALAETYGGGPEQTTMNLLVSSTHPAEAGLQGALAELLLDHGAAIEGVAGDGSPLITALAFGYPATAEILARRGARVDNVVTAAALDRIDLLERFVTPEGSIAPGVPLAAPHWYRIPNDPRRHLEVALLWAAGFGRTEAVRFLLDRGVDPNAPDIDGMSPLHRAAAGRHGAIVESLLQKGARLEAKNRWGGTVLDSTVWFSMNQDSRPDRRKDFGPIVEQLLAAGADVGAVESPTGDPALDRILDRYRGGRPG